MSYKLSINGHLIPPNSRETIGLPLPPLYTHTPVNMPVHALRGKKDGPRLFVSAAVHGDELNGIEIIRRLLKLSVLNRLKGILIAVPVVNIYGMIHGSRYLPDRRDLNRSFPGSDKGSMTARLAKSFMDEIVSKCTHGIDLHTGAIHRSNLPQIRANLDDKPTLDLAISFETPVLLNSKLRDGSLREAAAEKGIPMLLYEAGEAMRYDERSIRTGVKGIINVMRSLGMLPSTKKGKKTSPPVIARKSVWLRAPESGLARILKPLGATVHKGEPLGVIDDVSGGDLFSEIKAEFNGIIIGRTEIPLVHEGDALLNIAMFEDLKEATQNIEEFEESII